MSDDAPTGTGDDSEGPVVERLGVEDVRRAREAFTVMHEAFAEDRGELSDGYLDELLGDRSFWAVAAFDDGTAVGCITAHALPMTRHERSELFVYDLAVRADRRRDGIGRTLVETLVAEAAREGIDVVFVPADDDDDHALRFYAALGGRPSKVTIFDLGDS